MAQRRDSTSNVTYEGRRLPRPHDEVMDQGLGSTSAPCRAAARCSRSSAWARPQWARLRVARPLRDIGTPDVR